MSKLGRPRIETRPEGYAEAVRAVLDNEMSIKDAAKKAGITYTWFHRLFRRDYPDFRPKTDWQKKVTKEIGLANRKTVSWLEAYIGDEDLCVFIRTSVGCDVCPRNCTKKHRTKGLTRQISETRVPLKDPSKDLENNDA